MKPAWTEPAKYTYTLDSTCGERALLGKFAVTVDGGAVTETKGLDEAAQRALRLRIADLVPTIDKLLAEAENARAGGGSATVESDQGDGHPLGIRIDPRPNAADDEGCYAISDYQPGPA